MRGLATASSPRHRARLSSKLPLTWSEMFATCWSGYGLDADEPGDPTALRRRITIG